MKTEQMDEMLQTYLKDPEKQPWPVAEWAFTRPEEIPFAAVVRAACEANLCGRYGTCWTCPPGVGEWEALRDEYRRFERALVFSTCHPLEDSFDFEGMQEGRLAHDRLDEAILALMAGAADSAADSAEEAGKAGITDTADMPPHAPDATNATNATNATGATGTTGKARENRAARFVLLGAGGCSLCEKCSYPDAPCRHPDKARRSMEACGIDVVSLSRNLGLRYMNGENTVTYFSVLFYRSAPGTEAALLGCRREKTESFS